MTDEVLIHHGTTMVRRLRLAPGEAMPWHRDPISESSSHFGSRSLCVEYRDGGESQHVQITPGQIEWEEPTCVSIGR
jgi:hypothetical protein